MARGLGQVFDHGAGLEDTGDVLVALEEVGAFQPGNGGPHLGVGHAVLKVDVHLQLFVAEDLAGRDDDLLFVAAGGLAQAAENLGDVAAAELGERLHPELPLAILLRVEQHTLGLPPVTPGAAGLLQVVLQRARRVGVDDQPDVFLVNAHAEGVGGADDSGVAGEEFVLDALLLRGRQAGVEVGGFPAVRAQEFGGEFRFLPGGAEDDGAARASLGQAIREQVVDALQLVSTPRWSALRSTGSRARLCRRRTSIPGRSPS